MVAATPAPAPCRPPSSIEDFLWNIHTVLIATPGPLHLDQLKDAYSKHLGHKCAIERFLVVGDAGLGATLKRIPHIVTLFLDSNGTQCVKATQGAESTKQDLIDVDQNYRRELVKKNMQAKAAQQAAGGPKAKAKPAPAAPAAVKATTPAAPAGGAAEATAATAPTGEKRPADSAAGGDAKKAKAAGAGDGDTDTLARMLVQGVVRVLQNRQRAGKGPLPIGELEEEFKALWKVPFNLQQAGESDAATFLQKWPTKLDVQHDGTTYMLSLSSKKAVEKAKTGAPPPKAVAPEPKKGNDVAAPAKASPQQTPPLAPKASTQPATVGTGGSAPVAAAAAPAAVAKASEEGKNNGPDIQKRVAGPTRPPAVIEDFLWNIHSVIEASNTALPVDQLKEAYSKHLGHKCAIERFLVVGEGGMVATLKRIPHVVTISTKDGVPVMKATQPPGTTREQLVAADQAYRRHLQAKNQAAKAALAGQAKPAAAATPAAAASATGTAAPAAAAATTPVAFGPVAKAAEAGTRPSAEKRAAEAPSSVAGGEAKKPRTAEDLETLSKMLIHGIVRVLTNRQKEGKGPLPMASIDEEFKALWKVPFNLAQAGETDMLVFLQKWPNKVEVVTNNNVQVVQLAKKAAAKAAAQTPAAAGAAAPAASAAKAASGAVSAAGKSATAAIPEASTEAAVEPKASASTPVAAAAAGALDASNVQAGKVDGAAIVEVPQTLAGIQQQATEMLQAMQDMLRRQEALVSALNRFNA
mmetsp:Transcript_74550/g.207148  ORF Transcript_74550/g.207148 Transcript_74550/m.207148 type:complete len:752 (+) Transcript_74550:92-2347(+)